MPFGQVVEFPNLYLLYCFLLDQKEGRIASDFFNEINQHFLNLEGAQKYFSLQHIKTQQPKPFDIQHQV